MAVDSVALEVRVVRPEGEPEGLRESQRIVLASATTASMGIEVGLDVCLIDPRRSEQTIEMPAENASQPLANVVGDLVGVVET